MAGGELLAMLALHLVLTGLPGAAAALVAARLGVRSVPVLLAVGLATSGIVATLVFWSYYADPLLGETLSWLVAFAAAGLTAWGLWDGWLDRGLRRRLATPLALWALGSAFVLFLGFLHGGSDEPLVMAGTRFTAGMPADNYIPFFYAEWFFEQGHSGTPPVFPGEWLSSDRPPLQVGYVLSQRPLQLGENQLNYQVLGVVLQQLWIVGLWALLVAARVGRVTRALALVAVLASGLAIVNGFFVWPKLLPAALLLAAAALLATPLWDELRARIWAAALVAALIGLAMLGHGSTVFGAIPLLLVAAWRGLPSWRWVAVAAAVLLALQIPWSVYQAEGDPPGNRVVKWQLAGVEAIDSRGVGETLVDSYREVGLGGALRNKGQNFVTISGGGPMADHVESAVTALGDGDLRQAVEDLRNVSFFNLLPAFGVFLLAPVAMAIGWRRGRRRQPEWSVALTCFALLGIGAIAWGLLLFGDASSRTVIHQGSYLLPILGLCGAVAGLRAVWPRFAVYYVAVAAALTLAIYVPALAPLDGTSYSALAALLSAAGLAGFVATCLRVGEEG